MRSSTLLLKLIGEAGEEGATLEALDQAIDGLSRKAIVMATGVLAQRGLLERRAPGHYRLTAAGRLALEAGIAIKPGPRGTHATAIQARSLRAKLWRAMRALNKFGIDDLLLRGANGDEADARNNAGKYVNVLERAGYLIRLKHRLPGDAPTSPGFVRWLLVHNTGPKAPIWQAGKRQLHDPNTGKTFALDANAGTDAQPQPTLEAAHG
ncbi:hypothetical protein [Thiocystis violascens]|uniref:Uncharacterized protein n=1 Tax=Thiocystis violascens (strain ATCC 17096 / DSM 198 / 6111) TaxID=765911 RepID=I3YGS7_THIV6|nr:hypothetical protein [Thiocystis violascens]AFL76195.1 hypothetical protein Thivi_4392 [Thiocystis violascens DSM 198]